MPDPIVINPLQVEKNSDEWELLIRLLESQHTQDLVHPELLAGSQYALADGTLIQLTHTIVGYFKTSPFNATERTQRRFDILNNTAVLGEGGSGTVNSLAGKLVLAADHRLERKIHDRKEKIIKKQSVRSVEDISDEMKLTIKSAHLRARNSPAELLQPHDFYHYMVMKKFPDHLDQMMGSEQAMGGALKWSLGDRYLLSLRLLEGLKKQLFDKKIIHGDIKPENICLDVGKLNVRIIDVGTGRKTGSTKDKIGYSVHYEAPELLARDHPEFLSPEGKRAQEASDVFSMGRVLARLWGDWNIFWQRDRDSLLTDASHLKNALKYEQLFTVPMLKEDIPEGEQLLITNLLKAMTSIDPVHRPGIEEAMNQFRVLEFNHRLLLADPEKKAGMQEVFSMVNDARSRYLEVATPAQRFEILSTVLNGISALPENLQTDAVREWKHAFHEEYFEAADSVGELSLLLKQLMVKHEKMDEKYAHLIEQIDNLAFPYRFATDSVTCRAILNDFDAVKNELLRMKKRFTQEADVDDLRYVLNIAEKRYRDAFNHIRQNKALPEVVSEIFSPSHQVIFSSLMKGNQPDWVMQIKAGLKNYLKARIDDNAVLNNSGVLTDANIRRLENWLTMIDKQPNDPSACLKQLSSALGSSLFKFREDPLVAYVRGLVEAQQKLLKQSPRPKMS